ncbi:hypothetical protein JTE90_002083 [Oedothorax gibbosus]|uniref:Major facilitator superfamily (MFS) profile domain-containing protein n=1 Tax=Oedothorax gibbosus TaxID=931172 RepID=A0AAV6UEX6_9ARAC|nr:hypothetical protein JTE90_002083 [Oedothorax gibbosus]
MIAADDPLHRKRVVSHMVLLMMCFSCLFVLSAQRINVSITIVHMVNWTALDETSECRPLSFDSNCTVYTDNEPGKLAWSHLIQSQVLASYFYGLALGHWSSECLAAYLKVKWMALFGTLVASTCNFLTPLAATNNVYILIGLQFTKALGQAIVIPSFGMLVDAWVGSDSMAGFMGYCATALPLGAFITILVSGMICDSDNYGWEYVFYISGSIGIIWCLLWSYLASEYFYPTVLIYNTREDPVYNPERPRAPLRFMFTSKAVWAFLLCSLTTYWAWSFNLLLLPLYARRVFQAPMQWNYMASSAPNLLQAFLFLVAVMSSEQLVSNGILNAGPVRIFLMVIGFLVFATCNVLLTFAKCSRGYAALLNFLAYGFIGLNLAATSALPSDLSPNYGGVISATVNTVGPLFGSLLPLAVAFLPDTKEGIGNWNYIFYASALIGFVAMIIFIMIGPRKMEPWNDHQRSDLMELARNGFSDLVDRGHSSEININEKETPSEENSASASAVTDSKKG